MVRLNTTADNPERKYTLSNDNERHVVPNSDDGWDVVKPDATRASAHTNTQREVIDRAREMVGNAGEGEVRIHGRDGRLRDSRTIKSRKWPSSAARHEVRSGHQSNEQSPIQQKVSPQLNSGIYISSIELAGDQPPLQISPGTVTAIVGGNNTGKSTLLSQIYQWLSTGTVPQASSGQHPILKRLEVVKGEEPDRLLEWVHKNCMYQRRTIGNPLRPEGYVRAGTNPLDRDQLRQIWQTARNGHLGALAAFLVSYAEAGSFGSGLSTNRRPRPDDAPAHPLQNLESSPELRARIDEAGVKVFGQHITVDMLGNEITLRLGKPPDDVLPPGYYDNALPFREALDQLPRVDGQGHGMRSLLGKLFPVLAATHPIIIIDEPEAFLHPPQANIFGRILGDMARESDVQVILATHDRNILVGLLASKSPVSVVRLTRFNGQNNAYQLNSEDISHIWSDPVLRYSHVLDGLFHQRVVVVENERDCTFYSAALDAAHESDPLPINPSDILFVPTNGKDGIPTIARALSAIKVPVIASPDIDILDDEAKIKKLVTALGGDWSEYQHAYRSCTSYLRQPKEPVRVSAVAPRILEFASRLLKDDPSRLWDKVLREEVRALTRGGNDSWDNLKEFGIQAFRKDVEGVALDLLDRLDKIGLVVVRAGELESFGKGYSIVERKGLSWLRSALDKGVHRSDRAIEHVRRLVTAMPAVID
jgi:uncharacterized protein DUF2188/putative AbiEii toxin of type IV toxin-antitoxin system